METCICEHCNEKPSIMIKKLYEQFTDECCEEKYVAMKLYYSDNII